jgi:hypothetical protein
MCYVRKSGYSNLLRYGHGHLERLLRRDDPGSSIYGPLISTLKQQVLFLHVCERWISSYQVYESCIRNIYENFASVHVLGSKTEGRRDDKRHSS